MMYTACIECGKAKKHPTVNPRCLRCANTHPDRIARLRESHVGRYRHAESPGWKGGIDTNGRYKRIRLTDDHPMREMADSRGRVYVHRLAMAEALGRPLRPEENVHHVNGDTSDNRAENLMLFASYEEHMAHHRAAAA